MRRLFPIFALVVVASGCVPAASLVSPQQPPEPPPKSYLIHLPGIAGPLRLDQQCMQGFADGGLCADMEIFDWTCGDGGIPALWAIKRNHEQAKIIADKITEKYRADPRTKIYIVSHSGGAGPAVWALEMLPDDVNIEKLLMLAPALSPNYDLSKALAHVRVQAYAIWSRNDGLILGLGTRTFGTIDGVRGEAAGKVGFVQPTTADTAAYSKLTMKQYDPRWYEKYDYNGDHMGMLAYNFSRGYLSPLLTGIPATTKPSLMSHD